MDDVKKDTKTVVESFEPFTYYNYNQISRRTNIYGEELLNILETLTQEGRLMKGYQEGELYPSWRVNQ